MKTVRCENCIHWTRSNHPDLEDAGFGTCDMLIIEVEPAGGSSRWIKNLITRSHHKCLSCEETP